jgi:hypothetical protein
LRLPWTGHSFIPGGAAEIAGHHGHGAGNDVSRLIGASPNGMEHHPWSFFMSD